MRIARTTRIAWQHLLRRWRATRRHLRRGRATLMLLVLLALGLGEPLLCVIHCQIWLPLALHNYFAAQHLHAHNHAHLAAAPMAQPVGHTTGTAIMASLPLQRTTCAMQGGPDQGSTPFYVPPSPVHDMLPALVILILLVLLICMCPAAPPGDPPNIAHSPLLRPPIPFAA